MALGCHSLKGSAFWQDRHDEYDEYDEREAIAMNQYLINIALGDDETFRRLIDLEARFVKEVDEHTTIGHTTWATNLLEAIRQAMTAKGLTAHDVVEINCFKLVRRKVRGTKNLPAHIWIEDLMEGSL